MSDLWFNIKLGKRHLQLTNQWKLRFIYNDYWDEYPEAKWFMIFCLFGKHL